ncbi:alpha/beta hydrolase [Paenibacillus sp. FSL R10-2734]|uniref:alpha/beta fold hydrolase n=1 Tax=Paenibacillus sp. FSL R10-2734 TaxID=2954691 RepID=UPI0030DCF8D1
MKRTLFFLLKAVVVMVIAIVVFLAIVFTVNVICNKLEKGKIESYGQLVSVDGKNMNVTIQGHGEETVVLLPGYGTAAPGIDFKPLADELSPFYKVVVIEPFGYGLSDITEKERSTENIVSEIHECLQQLNIDRYILMGHSIAGIYGLDYVNKYKNEVSAFVGIDSSVPAQGAGDELPTAALKSLKQSGFYRLLVKLAPDQIISPDVDDKTKEQNRMISLKNMMNPNIISEAEHFTSNFKAAESLKFPKELPVIFFLVKDTTDVEGWEALHEEQIKDSLHGKMMMLEGDHYLHHTRSKEIVQHFRSFMGEMK